MLKEGDEVSDLFQQSGAIISPCGQYRYHLWRVWNELSPIMVFIMQNPSTADADQDDATIRRCLGFARREGCGGISVRNVFALRATDERELLTHRDPVGPENWSHLMSARNVSMMTVLVAAWGNRVGPKKRSLFRTAYCQAAIACAMQGAKCLGITKSGDPRHPLFVRHDAPMFLWNQPDY